MGLYEKLSIGSIPSFSILLITLYCLLSPISALKRYGEPCELGMHCESNRCSEAKKTCICGDLRSIGTKEKVAQIYDKDLGMCLSRVGQLCTLEDSNPALMKFHCIPEAICDPNLKINMAMSYCSCKRGYQLHKNRCISQVELRALNAKAPSSMDQVKSGEWNGSGSNSSKRGDSHMLAYISSFFVIFLCSQFPFR